MARDYKDRVSGTLRRSRRRRQNRWLWALPAVVVAMAAIAVFSFTGREDTAAESTESVSEPEVAVQTETTAAEKKEGAPSESAAVSKDHKPPSKKTSKKKAASAEKVPEVNLPEPRFTFYKILPEKEVIVSESEIRDLARNEKAGKTEAAGGYLIQAGSFAKQEEAEKMKALLAAAKVKAKMEKVLIENTAWYRVKIGPYKSLTEAEQMRAYLRKNKIDSVLQQTKP